jgi:hypothetical protein
MARSLVRYHDNFFHADRGMAEVGGPLKLEGAIHATKVFEPNSSGK